jgi:molybdopterin synthase catalytic subunit
MHLISIQTDDFSLTKEEQLVQQYADNCGAVVAFIGRVRGKDKAHPLTHLYVEHFPCVTEKEIEKIIIQAQAQWPLAYVKVIHRIGDLPAGDNIVMVLTASEHRKDAFSANNFIMDYLKTEAPFWKKEFFANGDADWVEMKESDLAAKAAWTPPPKVKCAGIILAGGLGTRMHHQDKGLVKLKGRALIEYQIEMLKDQVDYLVISANRNLDEYRAYGYPVITDLPQYPNMGPLGGIYSTCSQLPSYITHVQIVPCDSPFLPKDLVAQLGAPIHAGEAEITMATSESGEHPIVMQFKLPLLASIRTQLDDGINLRLRSFIRNHQYQTVSFEEACFVNFNDPETLAHWNNQ